ncbi:hypothetical protein [Alistipes communis]
MKRFLLPFMLTALSIGYSCSSDEGGGGGEFEPARMFDNRS